MSIRIGVTIPPVYSFGERGEKTLVKQGSEVLLTEIPEPTRNSSTLVIEVAEGTAVRRFALEPDQFEAFKWAFLTVWGAR